MIIRGSLVFVWLIGIFDDGVRCQIVDLAPHDINV
jgi:hypothetical protein